MSEPPAAKPLYNLTAFRAALATARILPRAVGQWIAPLIARELARRAPAGAEAMRQNLAVALARPPGELDALLRENIANFSRALADYFYYSSHSPAVAETLLEEWTGWEHLQAARAAGKGTLLVTGHLGNWELGGVILALRGIPTTVITLEEPSSALTAWREQYRQAIGIRTIAVGPGKEFAFVEMLQVLRRNECLAMLVDRPYAGTGAPVTLFGRETQFSTAPALLWQHSGATVIPAFVTRNATGRYTATAHAPVPMTGDRRTPGALEQNTQTLASLFESVIRHHPEQWYNYVPLWPSPAPL